MKDATKYSFFSGGHKGSEAEFGRQAEKYGVKQTTFSFEIISARMGRKYTRADKIRVVIQSIFYIINNGFQVFAIGWIQDDNTVKGGTGWGVELAKLFNRPISVFDQDKNQWYSWVENSWEESTPVIESNTFSGTGTRNLSEEGRKAIEELFQRSFS